MTNIQAKALLNISSSIAKIKLRLQELAVKTDYSDLLSDIESMWYDLDTIENDYSHRFNDAYEKRKKKK